MIEKSRFVYYCLHPASGIRKREKQVNEKQLTVSRWQDAVQRISVLEGTFWGTEKWWESTRRCEDEEEFTNENGSQFERNVMEQLLDFVCDESVNLDVLRKCFLYQVSTHQFRIKLKFKRCIFLF